MVVRDSVDRNVELVEINRKNIEGDFTAMVIDDTWINETDVRSEDRTAKFDEITLHTVDQILPAATVDGISSTEVADDSGDKKLLRKLDAHLIPGMTLLYFLNFLDRVNIGQAKLDGLTASLNLSSTQYNACLSVLFATYVAFEIPSNLILKKLRPSLWIPLIMVTWGIVMTLMGLVNSYGSLLACRLLLGTAEAGLFPGKCPFSNDKKKTFICSGANFYLSNWYKRSELAWRVSLLFSAASLAGAFGGILAYGINHMDGLGGQEGWRWIFYIEGIVTVIVGTLAFFFVNDFPWNRPKFLTEHECNRVLLRLHTDAGPGAGEHFSWKQAGSAFLDWKLYVWSLCFIGILVPLYSLSFFAPTIIQNLGFVNYEAQILTAPPYTFAFITTLLTAYFSDKYTQRGIFIVFWMSISVIGFIILIVVQNSSVKYFALFLTAGGIAPCLATCVTFISCNISPQTKRATAMAFAISVGNSGGAIAGQIYRSEDAPRFVLGHAINLVFGVMAIICASILIVSLRLENRRRDRLYGTITSGTMTYANSATGVIDLGTAEDQQRWGYENMSDEQIRNLGDKHATWRYIL